MFKEERHFCSLLQHIPGPLVPSAACRECEAKTTHSTGSGSGKGITEAVSSYHTFVAGMGESCAQFQVKGCSILDNPFALHISADATGDGLQHLKCRTVQVDSNPEPRARPAQRRMRMVDEEGINAAVASFIQKHLLEVGLSCPLNSVGCNS